MSCTPMSCDFGGKQCTSITRVETGTDFATRVPDTHYPMSTQVLVTVNLVSDLSMLQDCQPVRFLAYFESEIKMKYVSMCMLDKIRRP